MKTYMHINKYNHGFTLIEVIVTLIILSITGSILVTYFGSAITKSSEPIQRLQQAYSLKQVAENISEYYYSLSPVDLVDLAALQNAIGAENSTQANNFGSYTIINNDFIEFNISGAIATPPAVNNRLRVTIRGNNAIEISMLFVTD